MATVADFPPHWVTMDVLYPGETVPALWRLPSTTPGPASVPAWTSTVPPAAYPRIADCKPMPGVFIVPDRMPIGQAIEEILFLAMDVEPGEWNDQVADREHDQSGSAKIIRI